MKKGIIGKKIGMTQIFDQNGNVVPCTVIEAGPCTVVQKKTVENDGYAAIQVGFGDIPERKVNKPLKGHFNKFEVAPKRKLHEFRLENCDSYNVGDVYKVDIFEVGESVDVQGTSKGKGMQGTIKRHNFRRLNESHGTGPVGRRGGSMGGSASPSRVFKGKKLPGHMGAQTVTVQNLKIIKVDAENNLLAVKGSIPGPKGATVIISDSVKA